MKKPTKILLGLATLWPFLYLIIFFFFVFGSIFFLRNPADSNAEPPTFFFIILPLHLLTMLWIMALTIFYMVNVFRNDRVNKDMKVLWAVVIFMGSMIAMPIYWYLYFWKEPALPASGPAALGSGPATQWVNQPQSTSAEGQYVPPSSGPPNWRE